MGSRRRSKAFQFADARTNSRGFAEIVERSRKRHMRKIVFQIVGEAGGVATSRKQGEHGIEHLLRSGHFAIGGGQSGHHSGIDKMRASLARIMQRKNPAAVA